MGEALARANEEGNGSEFIQALADGYINPDLNSKYIRHKSATYLCPAPDDGIDGIHPQDLLVIDRSIKPAPGMVIMAEVDGQYCLRRIIQNKGKLYLIDDKGYSAPRLITGQDYYHGAVTASVHEHLW